MSDLNSSKITHFCLKANYSMSTSCATCESFDSDHVPYMIIKLQRYFDEFNICGHPCIA